MRSSHCSAFVLTCSDMHHLDHYMSQAALVCSNLSKATWIMSEHVRVSAPALHDRVTGLRRCGCEAVLGIKQH
ncbi:hypothetical protein Y032_0004g2055 [Ancylostoma ceylanicum]|uniref:Uncharacterized protein n=1 Tax=Ancylostoma ceylanicum TaxID=53326 RepID=A0A016VV17_9BILA|nr:hypothetical protein Y032_0004g2055 [Ancylostoma ceylanicum]